MEHHTIETLLRDSNWLKGICHGLTDDEHLAADLQQEGWLNALKHGMQGVEAPHSWFRKVLGNVAIQRFRSEGARRGRETSYFFDGEERVSEGPDNVVEKAELRSRIASAVLELEEPLKATVLLHFFEGHSIVEIVQMHGVSAAVVRTRMTTALKRLRKRLGDEYPGGQQCLLPLMWVVAGRGPVGDTVGAGSWAWTWGAVAGLLAGAVCIAWVIGLYSQGAGKTHLRALDPGLGADATLAQGLELETQGPAGNRVVGPKDEGSREGRLPCLLWSIGAETPIPGVLRSTGGALVGQANRTGQLRISRAWIGKPLIATAGYHKDLEIVVPELIEGEFWRIEMVVQSPTVLSVVDQEGVPMEGIGIGLWTLGEGLDEERAPGEQEAPLLQGKTHPDGTWSGLIGGWAVVRFTVPGGGKVFARVEPGVPATIVLPRHSLTVRFVDEVSGDPRPGMTVGRFDSLAESTPGLALLHRRREVSDRQGQVALPLPEGGMSFGFGYSNVEQVSIQNPDATPWAVLDQRNKQHIHVTKAGAGRVLILGVKDTSLRIRLTDSSTGLPLKGTAVYGVKKAGTLDAWEVGDEPMLLSLPFGGRIVGGELCAHKVRFTTSDPWRRLIEEQRGQYRVLVIRVPGYRVGYLSLYGVDEESGVLDLAMRRAESSPKLKFVWTDGSPFLGSVVVVEDSSGETLAEGRTGPKGLVESSFRPSGAARVVAYSAHLLRPGVREFSLGAWTASLQTEIPASAWKSSETIMVRVGAGPPRGTIRVSKVPGDRHEVIASDGFQFEYTPLRCEDGSYLFEGLPSGGYVVGTRSWVRAVERAGVRDRKDAAATFLTDVEGDECSELTWNPAWAMEEGLSGRVTCDPRLLRSLSLFAQYAFSGSEPSRRMRRLPMDSLGNYAIPIGDPRPLLLVAEFDVRSKALARFIPGEDCTIETGSIRIVIPGGKRAATFVVFRTLPLAEEPVSAWIGPNQFTSISEHEIREQNVIEGLPMSIVEVVFSMVGGEKVVRPVRMVAGGQVTVTL